jgi:hypothetical protein
VKHHSDAPLYNKFLDLPTNIRSAWKRQPGTDTLAYYKHSQVTAIKRFVTFGPGCLAFRPDRFRANSIENFTLITGANPDVNLFFCKLDRFSLMGNFLYINKVV